MVLTLLIWVYITMVCITWGNMFLQIFFRFFKSADGDVLNLPLVFFTGLALTGLLSFYGSLVMPVGLTAHAVILIPAVFYGLTPSHRRLIRKQFAGFFSHYSKVGYLLAGAAILMLLLLNTDTIIHPDTLGYHAQAIRWMEDHPMIPGLANLDTRLGFQSWWFASQALFRFSFLAPNPFLFVNGIVVVWFLLFVIERMHTSSLYGWLLLLLFSLLSWTQVRLTAASASPDFIVALYCWGAFYLFYKSFSDDNKKGYLLLTVLFSCAAVVLKFSAITILLLPVFIFLRLLLQKQWRPAATLTLFGGLILAPGIIRTYITTGYPFYPTTVLNIFRPDWQPDAGSLIQLQQYIAAYARIPIEGPEAANAVCSLSFTQWIPLWWQQLSAIDQLLLIIILFLGLYNLLTIARQLRERRYPDVILLTVACCGSLCWLFSAPAPRFGTGFLVPLVAALGMGMGRTIPWPQTFLKIAGSTIVMTACSVLILAYCTHRLLNYFQPGQLLMPEGVATVPYREVSCEGINFYITADSACGFTPVPAVAGHCPAITLRGTEIRAGFRPGKNNDRR